MKLLKIAIRNIKRNVRRTAITVVTVVIGVFVIVFAGGVINGFQNELIVQMIETRTGDLQIHKKGYRETLDIMPLDLSVNFDDVVKGLATLRDRTNQRKNTFFRANCHPGGIVGIFGKAIDVEKELAICPRVKIVWFLANFYLPMIGTISC